MSLTQTLLGSVCVNCLFRCDHIDRNGISTVFQNSVNLAGAIDLMAFIIGSLNEWGNGFTLLFGFCIPMLSAQLKVVVAAFGDGKRIA